MYLEKVKYDFSNNGNIETNGIGENTVNNKEVHSSFMKNEIDGNIDCYKVPHIKKYGCGEGNDDIKAGDLKSPVKEDIDETNIVVNNEKNRFIWSEIGQIVHSNRKPEYSLSSILRRTNLFEEEEYDDIVNDSYKLEKGVGYVENVKARDEKNLIENNKYFNNSKALELLQVTDIIKNVHREEIKIYLDEISFLRSQIINMNNNDLVQDKSNKISVGVNTFEPNKLSLNQLSPIVIKCVNKNELELANVIKVEIITDHILNNKEKDEYINKIENLNIEIQRQLEQRNEQYASVSHEYLRQKGLLIKEMENLKKEQEKANDLKEQIKKLDETLCKKEESFSVELNDVKNETNILRTKCTRLDSRFKTIEHIFKEINNYIINHERSVENIRLSNYVESLLLKLDHENEKNKVEASLPDHILKLCLSIENIFLYDYIKLIQERKSIKLCNNYVQTHSFRKSIKIKKQKLTSIFIQSVGYINNKIDLEAPIKVNNSFTCNYSKNCFLEPDLNDLKYNSNIDRILYNEKTLDYSSNVTTTRLRNEINILKNQLNASKQKYKLKELENERLMQEISYLKNKIVRSKILNSQNGISLSDRYKGENMSMNVKENRLTYKNHYNTTNKSYLYSHYESPKLKRIASSDKNWDEIFSVIQQLKDS
ncbi:hypothetical protein FG386_000234 [Cryptosporidium ryanae]|uniref:uncharacterized protein n=1 Tax=Cryptosporidium ryanae TaxID=515981 RepID=UPI00351A7ED3|nr:hypothetical protein FG386_000234 [Cryptosporidium ryanae]